MRTEPCRVSEKYSKIPEFGIENALASIVRRRWPAQTVLRIEREWDLTNGEARGVLYGYASRATFNKILRPRRGGFVARLKAFALGVEIVAAVTEVAFDQFLEHESARLRDEQKQAATHGQRIGEVVSFLRAGDDLDD